MSDSELFDCTLSLIALLTTDQPSAKSAPALIPGPLQSLLSPVPVHYSSVLDSRVVTYCGTAVSCTFRGEGTATYPRGHTYKGEFYNGKRMGKGTYSFGDGEYTYGEEYHGKKHGVRKNFKPKKLYNLSSYVMGNKKGPTFTRSLAPVDEGNRYDDSRGTHYTIIRENLIWGDCIQLDRMPRMMTLMYFDHSYCHREVRVFALDLK